MRQKDLAMALDWLQNGIWYSSAKLDNRLFQNVQDIPQSHKVYQKYQEKLESQTDSRRKKLSWRENPERDLPERCAITITICDRDNATDHILRKFKGGYRLHKS